MMAWLCGLLAVAALAAVPAAEILHGERLPPLRGKTLSGNSVVLPQAAAGRVALLLLGFTYESRFAVEAWAKRFRNDFGSDRRVTFYEVPMIGGLARLGKWFIDDGMRRGTPKDDYEHVVTVYRDANSWKQRVHFGDPNAAYLLLLDREGKVAWRYQGAFDESAFRALSSKVSQVVNAG